MRLLGRKGLHAEALELALEEQPLVVGHDVVQQVAGLGGGHTIVLVHRERQQPLGAIGQALPSRQPPAALAPVTERGTGLQAVKVAAALGDHVDHAEEGVVAVHGRAAAGRVFDAVDQGHVDRPVVAEVELVVEVVDGRDAVYQQQHTAGQALRATDAARAEEDIVQRMADVQPAHLVQHLAQRAQTEDADVLGGEHRDRGGRVGDLPGKAGRADDLGLEQAFEREVGQFLGRGRHGRPGRQGQCQGDG
jgi:hypothetical protein